MSESIQEVVQVFCPICARGVIVRNESMYKCPACGRQVCRPCFDKEHRLCIECCGPMKGTPNPRPTAGREERWTAREAPGRSRPVGRDRTRQGIWFFGAGIAAFAAVMVTSLFVSVPPWLTTAAAGAGVLSFVGGIVIILRD
ncbi:MAG: hypothetical protein MUF78_10055 [Candidatus Edwardsbacteria bacterium]|jgi:hypothetical protein|nr:hypothetical protein [Candidatus Edwardsbacteria bacterium]